MDVKVDFDLTKINKTLQKGIVDGVIEINVVLLDNINVILNGVGTGVKYSGNTVRSSKKGFPPALQTARLRNSWTLQSIPKVTRRQVSSIVSQEDDGKAGVASPLYYGAVLEDVNKLDRPYLRGRNGAVFQTQAGAQNIMDANIKIAIDKIDRSK